MKIIVHYGPPASGKFTIGKMLAEKTGYFLFHNHLSIDFLKNFFERQDETFIALDSEIKLRITDKLLESDVSGIIYTLVYRGFVDDEFIQGLLQRAKDSEHSIHFVKISCSDEVLMERVGNEDRREYKKVHKKEHLEKFLKSDTNFPDIPNIEYVEIDSAKLSPEEAASFVIANIKD